MSKNSRIVWLVAISSATVVVLVLIWNNRFSSEIHSCSDGPHPTIDTRDFRTQYSAYSVEFEVSTANQEKLAGKLEPHQLQQLTQAVQMANEFRKWLVAGYNSCAISKAQYAEFGIRFQHLDQVAREIDNFSSKDTLTPAESQALSRLVEDYRTTAANLGRSQ